MNEQLNEILINWLQVSNGLLWNFLIVFLLGVGIFYTLITGAVQLRFFLKSIKLMTTSRKKGQDLHGITPFQAFVTGLASRVGVGNIAGVAIAIAIGGPGAIFWMWLTAFLGMSSAFVESSLAQLFKIKDHHNQRFRGGPAYYISQGLKQKWLAIIFAISLIFTYGFAFNAVQANAVMVATSEAWGWNHYNLILHLGSWQLEVSWIGLFLVLITALVIFGGIKRIAHIAEGIVPLMALLYLAVALYIMIHNWYVLPAIFSLIFDHMLEFNAAAGGFLGGIISLAMVQGIKRGLFSNEAGMGSAPNAAAAADVKHPVNQGLIQMLGVFVDTFVVCTCTAMIILVSGLYQNAGFEGVALTQKALVSQIGPLGSDFLAILLFLFAYSTILGNYAYAESNVQFINNHPNVMLIFRIVVLMVVYLGSISSIPLVWLMADLFMGIMTSINLLAITLLMPFALMLLKDYTAQLKQGIKDPVFKLDQHPQYQNKIKSDIW